MSILEYAPVATNEVFYDSLELHARILDCSKPLSVLEPEASERRNVFYNHMEVQRTELQKVDGHPNGHSLYIKYEGDQPGGRSFKARGGASAVLAVLAERPEVEHVHIGSAGNAAQGVGFAGNKMGIKTTAHVVRGASSVKVGALLENGIEVVSGYDVLEHALEGARMRGNDENAASIEPFNQIEVIAGQATIAYEILQDLLYRQARGEIQLTSDVVKIYVPVGGGGLIAGIASVIRWAKDEGFIGENVQVIGVQMEGCDAARRSIPYWRRGMPLPADLFTTSTPFNGRTDGAAVRIAGDKTMAIIADPRFVARIDTVTEAQVGEAMLLLSNDYHGQKVEPTGALSLAGARKYAATCPTGRGQRPLEHHITITSGANVDDSLFTYFAQKAAAAAERSAAQKMAAERYAQELAAYRANFPTPSGPTLHRSAKDYARLHEQESPVYPGSLLRGSKVLGGSLVR